LALFRTMAPTGGTGGLCSPHPLPSVQGIGFVSPVSPASQIRHNLLSLKHLSSFIPGQDWLCFAGSGSAMAAPGTLPALAHFCQHRGIGFVSQTRPRGSFRPGGMVTDEHARPLTTRLSEPVVCHLMLLHYVRYILYHIASVFSSRIRVEIAAAFRVHVGSP